MQVFKKHWPHLPERWLVEGVRRLQPAPSLPIDEASGYKQTPPTEAVLCAYLEKLHVHLQGGESHAAFRDLEKGKGSDDGPNHPLTRALTPRRFAIFQSSLIKLKPPKRLQEKVTDAGPTAEQMEAFTKKLRGGAQ